MFASVTAFLVDTRLDPIVNPGSCSGHVHSVYGRGIAGMLQILVVSVTPLTANRATTNNI
jgi:hypothetical protein